MKPMEAVFISDLHLHPEMPLITDRFEQFIHWAKTKTEAVYILGDFLHVWPGDDGLNHWSRSIADLVAQLDAAGVRCFFIAGNRDFLLGEQFARLARWTILPDPYFIELGNQRVLLSHGDGYCTEDKLHQWFRWLTRSAGFCKRFMRLPLHLRHKWVKQVRSYSQQRQQGYHIRSDVVAKEVSLALTQSQADILIHGHTHRYGVHMLPLNRQRFVLSDWDDKPRVLCYYKTYRFRFVEFDCLRGF